MKKEILLFIGSVLFTLICLEIGLRVYKWSRNDDSLALNVCQYDKLLGWRGKPNLHGGGYSEEGSFNIDSNSRGYRDIEYNYEKPNGIKRIVVLGDSFTWGEGVRLERSFPKALEQVLGGKYQVLSLGMLGYSTDQELLALSGEGLKYKPDVVIMAFFLDDVFNNGNMVQEYPKSHYIIDKNDKLVLKNVPVPYLKSPLRSVELIKTQIHKLKTILGTPAEYRKDGWLNVLTPKYLTSKDWQLTLRLLQEVNNLCRLRNIKFMVTVIPLSFQVAEKNTRLPQKVLLEFGEKSDIPVLDFLPVFEKHNERLYFLKDLHWNEKGHYIAAQAIYDFLFKKGLLPE